MATLTTTTIDTSLGKHSPAIIVTTAIIAVAALVTLALIILIIYLYRRRALLNAANNCLSDKNNAVDLEKCISAPTAPTPTLAIKTSDEHTGGRMPHLQPRIIAHCQPLTTYTSTSSEPPPVANIKSGDHIRANFAKLIKSTRLDLGAAFSSIPLAPARKSNRCTVQKLCNLKPPPPAKLSSKPMQGTGIITRDWSLSPRVST